MLYAFQTYGSCTHFSDDRGGSSFLHVVVVYTLQFMDVTLSTSYEYDKDFNKINSPSIGYQQLSKLLSIQPMMKSLAHTNFNH